MKNEVIISKMVSYCHKITSYCKTETYDSFISNSLLLEACVFNLSQIGELTRKLDASFTAEHTNIPWVQLRGLRNRIVHDYEGVNLRLVWNIVDQDLPELLIELESLMK